MKYLFLLLLFSCTEPKQDSNNYFDSTTKIIKADLDSMSATLSEMDSSLYYFKKQMDYKLLRDEYEIKYLRTENEHYRIAGNIYADSSHYYFLLLHKIAYK